MKNQGYDKQKLMQKAVTWPCGVCGKVLVVIQYSVLVDGFRYTRSVVV